MNSTIYFLLKGLTYLFAFGVAIFLGLILLNLLIKVGNLVFHLVVTPPLYALHVLSYPIIWLLRIFKYRARSVLQLSRMERYYGPIGFYVLPPPIRFLAKIFGVRPTQHQTYTQFQYQQYNQPQHDGRTNGFQQEKQTKRPPTPVAAEIDDPYTVLGVARTASSDEIREAFKKAITRNHPDKLANLDPALQALANERTVRINKAYKALVK